jgi:CubicO group peptidase (beta-lactamase class C family)
MVIIFIIYNIYTRSYHKKNIIEIKKLNLENWQNYRNYGLKQFEKICRDAIIVNAEHIRTLNEKYISDYNSLESIQKLLNHKDLDSMIILQNNNIVFEHYANKMTKDSLHSCQSSTKTILNLLIGKAFMEKKINLNSNIDQYIPNIGSGFYGRSINDLLSMNIKHEIDETRAYTNVTQQFENDESSSGFRPSKIYNGTRKDLLLEIKGGNKDGTNINKTGKYFYASINTDLGGWIVEIVQKIQLQQLVRDILHAIGGENQVFMATDKKGFPIIMGGMIATTRDFARYGLLLMSGGESFTNEKVGGGSYFVNKTINEGQIPLQFDGFYYNNSMYVSEYGMGHAGWGGQFLWVDPMSKTVIVVFSGLSGDNPADPMYMKKMVQVIKDVVMFNRKLIN